MATRDPQATITKVKPRNVTKTDKRKGIINNGSDNAYPTHIERIILSSVTAKAAAEMYANFLVGNGFKDKSLNSIVVGMQNYKPITAYDLLERTARSISFQNGAVWHLNYGWRGDGNYFISEIQPIVYKYFRLGEHDDLKYNAKGVIYDNWDRVNSSRIQDNDLHVIDVFNPRSSVIDSQVKKAEGITNYKGQVYWKFFEDEYNYPLSPIDVARDDADTEYQISKFKNGELSRNFFAKYILRHAYFENQADKKKFVEQIEQFQGGENNGSLMLVEDDIEQDDSGEIKDNGLKFEKIEQNINDKLFVDWEQSIANNIRKSYKAIPPVLIDYQEGKLGNTSGESLVQAGMFYNEMTKKDRRIISNMFKEIFAIFETPVNSDFEIEPLKFGEPTSV
jgi:hypothetical protein